MEKLSLKLGYSTVTWGKDPDVQKMLEEIKKAGFSALEFQQPIGWLGKPDRLIRLLRKFDLEVAGVFHGSALLSHDEKEIEAHKKVIDFGAALETDIYMVAGGWLEGRSAKEEDYVILADNLEELADYALQYKMEVTFHPHMGSIVETHKQIYRLFSKAEKVTLCPDTAHLALAGSDPINVIKEYQERITHVHIKDYRADESGEYKPELFVELGKGDIRLDNSAVLNTLKDINYDRWVIVELDYTNRTTLESLRINREYLSKLGY